MKMGERGSKGRQMMKRHVRRRDRRAEEDWKHRTRCEQTDIVGEEDRDETRADGQKYVDEKRHTERVEGQKRIQTDYIQTDKRKLMKKDTQRE